MITIRQEHVTDYASIGELHALAFGNRVVEASIVALLRQRRAFDPELSLVAEIDGKAVGHVLFSPYQMRLLGQLIPVVNLAPIAVDPKYQGHGIGGQLIIEGHRLASAKGYFVSLLLGYTSYYPRFGYRTHAFGSSQVVVRGNEISGSVYDTCVPAYQDIAVLNNVWLHEEGAVDMSLEPGYGLLDWLSPNPAVHATVYLRDGIVVGYTRIHTKEPTNPRVFLARDHEAARGILTTLAFMSKTSTHELEYKLPLHPFSASTSVFGHANCIAQSASMVCSLGPGPLDEYMSLIQSGQRPPGRIIWPNSFDLE